MAASGKDAQTVYRNREGRRIDREEWVELQQKKKKKRAADYPEQDSQLELIARDRFALVLVVVVIVVVVVVVVVAVLVLVVASHLVYMQTGVVDE